MRRRRRRQVGLLLGARSVVVELLGPAGEPGTVVVGQRPQDVRFDEAAPHVVGSRAPTGQGDDLFGGLGPEAQHPRTERDLDVLAERALSGSNGPAENLDHAHVALELGHGRVVDAPHPDLGHQAGHGREADAGLAQ